MGLPSVFLSVSSHDWSLLSMKQWVSQLFVHAYAESNIHAVLFLCSFSALGFTCDDTVCTALVDAGIFSESSPPNHVLLNEYTEGQGIGRLYCFLF